jgi:Cu(I)/Ag(I) efflux system membrane protein CusA/SilA
VIDHIIHWSLKNKLLVIGASALLTIFGILALTGSPVDALPDLSENQVIVFADWMGRSPLEVEQQITSRLSLNLQGLEGVKTVRGSSMFGFSLITVVFKDEVAGNTARQRVLERLTSLQDILPEGVKARMGPNASGIGWVYQYYLKIDPAKLLPDSSLDLGQLRSLQDHFIRYQLSSVPDVAEVASVGGFVTQYQIEVDSHKMKALGISLDAIFNAVESSNLNVGGKGIEENGMEFIIRGLGQIRNAQDLEKIVLEDRGESTICLKDVARVQLGGDFRRGILDVDGREAVGGIVIMRSGANARSVIERVKEKIAKINPALPPGVRIESFYDRSGLIDQAIGTLRNALLEEICLVILVHILFLFHFRSILIVVLPLPVSVLISFLLMRLFGISSNIMSLSGIAIAVGVLVDAAIVLSENVIRSCEDAERVKGDRLSAKETLQIVETASKQVGRPIFFAMAIIILAFIPVFALTGQEGRLFHPLAFTKTFAMLSSTLLALTLVPVLCTGLVRGPFRSENNNPVMRFLLRIYDPILEMTLRRPLIAISVACLIFGAAVALIPKMGSEFMPPLEEGDLLLMPTFIPAVAPSEVHRVMAWQDKVLKTFPEVVSAAGKLGRSETATDPAPTEMIETTIQLKPPQDWRPGMTKDKLVSEMMDALNAVPGSIPGFLQPIQARVLMTATGIRSQLGVKILGNNLEALQQAALDVQIIVESVPGATGVTASRNQGKPYLEIQVNRDAMRLYGMRAQDVLDTVEAGLGGRNITSTSDGRNTYPIQVRLQREDREEIARLRDIPIQSPSGKIVPLGAVAQIQRNEGPNEIISQDGQMSSYVQANVQGRDLGSFVEEVKKRLQKEIAPQLARKGMTLEYAGEYENQQHAAKTLTWIVPSVLLIIFLLLCALYRSAGEAAHVILAIPFALSGGLFLQYALGWHFSVAVWVGYIALFGTAIQTAIVMVVYLEEAVKKKKQLCGEAFGYEDLIEAVKEGARQRLRPKIMTVAAIVFSLLPIMWSRSAGADVMQPIATPVLGGMLTSLVHILLLTPVIFLWINAKKIRTQENQRLKSS